MNNLAAVMLGGRFFFFFWPYVFSVYVCVWVGGG